MDAVPTVSVRSEVTRLGARSNSGLPTASQTLPTGELNSVAHLTLSRLRASTRCPSVVQRAIGTATTNSFRQWSNGRYSVALTLRHQVVRLVVTLTLLCGLVTASLAFYAGTYQSRGLREPLLASAEVLLVYAVMLAAGFLYRHPRMSWQGGTILLLGISMLSLAGVEMFVRRVSKGPPAPDTAAHLAIFIYPAILMSGALLTVVSSMLISGSPVPKKKGD